MPVRARMPLMSVTLMSAITFIMFMVVIAAAAAFLMLMVVIVSAAAFLMLMVMIVPAAAFLMLMMMIVSTAAFLMLMMVFMRAAAGPVVGFVMFIFAIARLRIVPMRGLQLHIRMSHDGSSIHLNICSYVY